MCLHPLRHRNAQQPQTILHRGGERARDGKLIRLVLASYYPLFRIKGIPHAGKLGEVLRYVVRRALALGARRYLGKAYEQALDIEYAARCL